MSLYNTIIIFHIFYFVFLLIYLIHCYLNIHKRYNKQIISYTQKFNISLYKEKIIDML
mgnify:CR=1 FL=1